MSLTSAFAADFIKEVELSDGRVVLADSNGMSVYTFDPDGPSQSNCHGQCLDIWPAVTVEDISKVELPYGTLVRDDGTLQLTLNESPLYLFIGDQKEGDINGDMLHNVWHIVAAE